MNAFAQSVCLMQSIQLFFVPSYLFYSQTSLIHPSSSIKITISSFLSETFNLIKFCPIHGPATHKPDIGEYNAPCVEQTINFLSSSKKSLGCQSRPARMLDKKRDVMAKASGHGPPPPPVSRWNQRPLHMTIPSYAGFKITRGALTYNSEIPFEFETSVFAGRCLIRFRDCPPPPAGAAPDAARRLEEYFRGRARTFQCVVQGKFKRRIRADEAVTGHEFFQPLLGIPGKRFVKTLVHILRAMNPSLRMSLFARKPQPGCALEI